MVAIVSDELREKLETDCMLEFYKEIKDMKDCYDNFSELQLLDNDSEKILLLRESVFRLLNHFPFRITLITEYPGEVTFFREKASAEVAEIKWHDYKMRSKNDDTATDSSDAFDDE